jgi:Zn-dependent metalloprotease
MCPKFNKHWFLLFFIFFPLFTFSQTSAKAELTKARILADTKVSNVQVSKERSTPSLIVFKKTNSGYSKGETPGLLRTYLSLRPGYDDMLPVKETKVYSEFQVPEYQQYFKGVKVEYSKYKALAKNEQLAMLAGSFYEVPLSLSVTPAINEGQALQFAKQHVGAKHYVYEDLQKALTFNTDPRVKRAIEAELKETFPKGELTVIKDFTNKEAVEMKLAYKFNLYASEPLSRGYIFVDAQTGKILLYNAIIKHASVPTNVVTRYAGTRSIGVKQISGNDPNSGLPLTSSHPTSEIYIPGTATYVLIDDRKGKGIETYDLNGVGGAPISLPGVYGQAKSFTDVDNNWTLAEHKRGPGEEGANELENDDIAWDAHWGASMVYDYWKQKQGRLSYDNNDAAIKSYIHYGPAYDNAFWNGTAMTYGDGSGEAAGGFKALTSLDVCGHEIGHGVCSFTSDLVYEKESGAMNEALSDIWAASIEYFAIKNVDPTLQALYKPFSIGEQISASPLRRMDNPKLSGNPDTYGGENWSDPNCTPTLVNDQCGVHNNSGLLNKWYYLVTLGSGAGSGPDVAFATAGVDDGVNDNGDAYSVTGLGFDVSERITYLTELLLSSTATYAEFREVAIGVATAYSGDPCGNIVQTITNGMYAIGVGAAFVAPCTTTFGFVFQPGVNVSESNGSAGCDAERTLNIPILLPANSTATITYAGTATQGADYTVSATSTTNGTNSNKQDTLKVSVKNDAVIESNETIIINVTVSNLNGNPSNTSYTITIKDDDVAPRIGDDLLTLLTENFDAYPDGLNQPTTWTEVMEIPDAGGIDPTANGKNQWGVFSGKLSIAPKTNLPGPIVGGTYLPTSTSITRITAPEVDARGLNNIRLKFDYTVQGEVDANGVDPEAFGKFDYMAIVYSYDNVNFTELGQGYYFASLVPTSGTFDGVLPAFLNNQQFYLGFRWVNDANAGGPVSVSIDDLLLQGAPKRIESELNNSASETQGPNQEVFFYSKEDGEIIAKISNAVASNYGCMTTNIARAGESTSVLYTDGEGSHMVADKYIQVMPTTNNALGQYTISLYYTEAEIAAVEAATGTSRSAFFMYKSSAASPATANDANTVRTPATYTDIPGAGGLFTASFTTGFSGFTIGQTVEGPLPVTCLELKGVRLGNNVLLTWKVAAEQNNRMFEVERSTDGINFNKLVSVNADNRNNGLYSYADKTAAAVGIFYYRLKQVDANGTFRYICNTVAVKLSGKEITISNIFPNPVKGNAFVKVVSGETRRIRIELMNSVGQVLNAYNQSISEGSNTLSINVPGATAGNYMIRFKDDEGRVLSTQAFVVR